MAKAASARIPWNKLLTAMARAVGEDISDAPGPLSPTGTFRLLVTTMISPRTKDEVTDAAAERLFAVASTPAEMAALPEKRIATLIYPAGFYRVKARAIRSAAMVIRDKHQSRVPASIDGLLELPGVGRKIANLVLSRGFAVDAICVDTHVHRISNRTGWVRTKSPGETEAALNEVLPVRYWRTINEMLVTFGKRVCTPLSPRCSSCPIRTHCPRVGVTKSR